MITKSIAVPETRAPKTFVKDARRPTAAPPITVKGIIYLSRMLSKTLSSCLNPETCNPEDIIFLAWAFESMLDVFTQNIEKITEKAIKNKVCVIACHRYSGKNPPLIINPKIFVEPIQKAKPFIGTPSWNLPKNVKYEAILAFPVHVSIVPPKSAKHGAAVFSINPPNSCIFAINAETKITGITLA